MPSELEQAAGSGPAPLPAQPATSPHTRPAPSLPLTGPLCLPPAPTPLLHHPSSFPLLRCVQPLSPPDVPVPGRVLGPARPPLSPRASGPAGPSRAPLGTCGHARSSGQASVARQRVNNPPGKREGSHGEPRRHRPAPHSCTYRRCTVHRGGGQQLTRKSSAVRWGNVRR